MRNCPYCNGTGLVPSEHDPEVKGVCICCQPQPEPAKEQWSDKEEK